MIISYALCTACVLNPYHNQREINRGAKLIIHMSGTSTAIMDPALMDKTGVEPKKFTFDYSYWSHDGYEEQEDGYLAPVTPKYADQVRDCYYPVVCHFHWLMKLIKVVYSESTLTIHLLKRVVNKTLIFLRNVCLMTLVVVCWTMPGRGTIVPSLPTAKLAVESLTQWWDMAPTKVSHFRYVHAELAELILSLLNHGW